MLVACKLQDYLGGNSANFVSLDFKNTNKMHGKFNIRKT